MGRHPGSFVIAILTTTLILSASIETAADAAGTAGCTVTLQPASQTVTGTVVLVADAPGAMSVDFYANDAYLGPAVATGYGWLFTPDNGQTFGWNTTTLANGSVSLTCRATNRDGVTTTSAPITATLANSANCAIAAPTPNQTLSGRSIALSASPPSGTTAVTFHLHSATIADHVIGRGTPTLYGWVYFPEGGGHWDSTQFASGTYTLTCQATLPSGTTTSQPVAMTLQNPEPAVRVYGAPGTFGSVRNPLPSGQPFVTQPVTGWNPPAGTISWFTATAADGTVISGNFEQNLAGLWVTMDTMSLQAFNPATGSYNTIPITTSTGKRATKRTTGEPGGAAVGDILAINGGNAIAFISPITHLSSSDPAMGTWPAFGILTKVNNQWRVASGNGWRNQWTGADLAASNPTIGADACPTDELGGSSCRYPSQMALLPQSKDIVIAQYFPDENTPKAGIVVLHVDGPDAAGRFTTSIKAVGNIRARMPDPACPGRPNLLLAPQAVRADPTGKLGDERFLLNYDIFPPDDPACADSSVQHPRAFEEWTYDAGSGSVRPVSAPMIPGDTNANGDFFGDVGSPLYDSDGNLWVARSHVFEGGPVAVYANTNGARKFGGPECPFDPNAPRESYVTSRNGKTAWGQTCRPDYDIMQPRAIPLANLAQDPKTKTVILVPGISATNAVAIRRSGYGKAMTFTVGNLLDGGFDGLAIPQGGFRNTGVSAVDASGRLWMAIGQTGPRTLPGFGVTLVAPYLQVPQFLASVDINRLFNPAPVPLESEPYTVDTKIQAEASRNVSTTQRTGGWATKTVNSVAYVNRCIDTCAADHGFPGEGYYLDNSAGTGVQSGTFTYTVNVPTTGRYALRYRVRTPANTHSAALRLTAAGTTTTTAVDTGGGWQTVTAGTITLPAGTQTIKIKPPSRGGGWNLDWFSLTRQ